MVYLSLVGNWVLPDANWIDSALIKCRKLTDSNTILMYVLYRSLKNEQKFP